MITKRSSKCAPANRRYAIEFVSHWFYNLIGLGGRARLHLSQYRYGGRAAPVTALGRCSGVGAMSDFFP
jgi:hypothetical protein